jgi:succinyl-CoA synthetase beta subunit
VRAWRALWRAGTRPSTPAPRTRPIPDDVARALAGAPAGPLPYTTARRALEAHGVLFCRERIATNEDEAFAAAEAIGYPVVVKADAPELLHKTEAGGVYLDVRDSRALRAAVRDLISRLNAPRVVIQEHVPPGAELLLGARRDPNFGPVVAVGTGGILTEAIKDTSLALAPVGQDEARAILREGIRARLLAGLRGRPPAEDPALIEAIVGIGDLIATYPRVHEVDVNPIITAGPQAIAVDAVIILGDEDTGERVAASTR